ncbi:alcohol dehydrogenase catalytic domain-containing protein, partial [Nocardia neocaledoniensis]|uniref:alcohol dehydrogenase catalytic domain-containing protein n=1 Tax=Nocardia neocaledoniensis TaxID=236511 RepID=UPI0024556B1F
MHAIQVSEHGGPEVLRYVEVADPPIGPGQLLVDTQAVGVNYIDIYFRTGLYPQQTPYVPGSEGTGVVAEVGAEVTEFAVGDRVAWAAAPGRYADRVAGDAAVGGKVAAGVGPPRAAASMAPGRIEITGTS